MAFAQAPDLGKQPVQSTSLCVIQDLTIDVGAAATAMDIETKVLCNALKTAWSAMPSKSRLEQVVPIDRGRPAAYISEAQGLKLAWAAAAGRRLGKVADLATVCGELDLAKKAWSPLQALHNLLKEKETPIFASVLQGTILGARNANLDDIVRLHIRQLDTEARIQLLPPRLKAPENHPKDESHWAIVLDEPVRRELLASFKAKCSDRARTTVGALVDRWVPAIETWIAKSEAGR